MQDHFYDKNKIKLAILQRVCTTYRLGLFRLISKARELQTRIFIGEDIPDSKVRSTKNLAGIDLVKLPTLFFKGFGSVFPYHRGLIKLLREFDPDVVLCEGESNILNYLQAIVYRRLYKNVHLVHWSLGGLPGSPVPPSGLKSLIKVILHKQFDDFITYSSFGKKCLTDLKHPESKIFIATNVADTTKHLAMAAKTAFTPSTARGKLGLPDRFTVFYSGTMDNQKKPGLLLDIAQRLNPNDYNFVLAGGGKLLSEMRRRAERENLQNVFLPGYVSDELPLYYRAADVMVLPGRGGMAISEAMAWELPVIVYRADGTEYDLVRNGETGLLLQKGTVEDFLQALVLLKNMPDHGKEYGVAGKKNLLDQFTIEKMAKKIVEVIMTCSK